MDVHCEQKKNSSIGASPDEVFPTSVVAQPIRKCTPLFNAELDIIYDVVSIGNDYGQQL